MDRTFSDAVGVLSQVPTLSPRTDIYSKYCSADKAMSDTISFRNSLTDQIIAFRDGHSALLLHFSGTLPVLFRGAAYSFPISLWILHGYPFEGPIAYVIPTEEMAIRPGQYVSDEGRIYHPYLASWRPDVGKCIHRQHSIEKSVALRLLRD